MAKAKGTRETDGENPPTSQPSGIRPTAPSPQARIIGTAGNTGADDPSIEEIGNTGLLQTGGFVWEEFLSRLRGITGAKIFQEMADNDTIISAVVYAITMLVRQVEWHFEPADDSPAAAKAADFAEGVIMDDMADPWTDTISEIMTMAVHGYSVFEILWKVRSGRTGEPHTDSRFDDNRIGIARLAPRSQLTIWRWIFNYSGDVAGVEQLLYNTGLYPSAAPNPAQSRGMVIIPAEKLLLFRIGSVRANPESKALIRSCYVPYLQKQFIMQQEQSLAQRAAGTVVLKIPQEYMDSGADEPTKRAYAHYKRIAATLAANHNSSVVLPSDYWDVGDKPKFEISYMAVNGPKSQDNGDIIERIDKRMAMSVLADFIMIGHNARGGSGSYALSSNKTDTFMTALAALVSHVADVINRTLLPKLWRYNGMDESLMPTMMPDAIEAPNLAEVGALLTALAGAGAELFPDMTLENAIRHQAGWPEKQDDSITAQIDEARGEASLASSQAAAENPIGPGAPPGALPLGPPKPGQKALPPGQPAAQPQPKPKPTSKAAAARRSMARQFRKRYTPR